MFGAFDQFGDVLTRGRFDKGTFDLHPVAAILSAILVIRCRTKPIFKLELKVDGSNSYIRFGRIRLKMTELE